VAAAAELQQIQIQGFETEIVVEVAAEALVKCKQQQGDPHLLQDKVLLAVVAGEHLDLAVVVHQKLAETLVVEMVLRV
jgi:uncharacterized protein YwlG (UPF0340 family)